MGSGNHIFLIVNVKVLRAVFLFVIKQEFEEKGGACYQKS